MRVQRSREVQSGVGTVYTRLQTASTFRYQKHFFFFFIEIFFSYNKRTIFQRVIIIIRLVMRKIS